MGLEGCLASLRQGNTIQAHQKSAEADKTQGTHFNPQDESKGFDDTYKTHDPKAYGKGPLQIAHQGFVPSSGIGFMNACAEALGIPIVKDYNLGNSTGIKQGTATLDGNLLRSSSFDSYLKEAKHRENLDVLYYAPVRSILFDQTGDKPRAKGFEFIDHPSGRVYQVYAAKEAIVALGAFNSPQLLMVSVSELLFSGFPARV